MDEEAGLAGGGGAGSAPTVAALCAAWLASRRGQVQPTTLEAYRYQLSRYVLPWLGEVPLDRLTSTLLTATWAQLLDRGGDGGRRLAVRTVASAHAVLRTALRWAVDEGLVAADPARRARPPRLDPDADAEEPFRVWSASQVARFLALTSKHPLQLVFLVAVSTGMRRGEVLGLRWDDVDLDRAELLVCRSLAVAGDRLILKQPKQGRPRRIAVDGRVVAALRARSRQQRRERQAAGEGWADRWGLVVTTALGAPVYPSRVSAGFAILLRRLDLPRIRFHDLRHSHASILLQAGVAPHVVAQRLGHAKPSMTLNVYAHVLPASDDDAVERFTKMVYGAGMHGEPPAPGIGSAYDEVGDHR